MSEELQYQLYALSPFDRGESPLRYAAAVMQDGKVLYAYVVAPALNLLIQALLEMSDPRLSHLATAELMKQALEIPGTDFVTRMAQASVLQCAVLTLLITTGGPSDEMREMLNQAMKACQENGIKFQRDVHFTE